MKDKTSPQFIPGMNTGVFLRNFNKPFLLGVSGVAQSGKDSFYNALCKLYPHLAIDRIAFADCLKGELSGILEEHFGIDVFNMSKAEKEKVRPLMVWWGKAKRDLNPDYWVDLAFSDIDLYKEDDIVVVTDVRCRNELDRIREMGGKVVYVERLLRTANRMFPDGLYPQQPANEEESQNTVPLRDKADFLLEWLDFEESGISAESQLREFLEKENFLPEWLDEKRNV